MKSRPQTSKATHAFKHPTSTPQLKVNFHIYPLPSYDQLPATPIIVDPFDPIKVGIRPVDVLIGIVQGQALWTNDLLAVNKL